MIISHFDILVSLRDFIQFDNAFLSILTKAENLLAFHQHVKTILELGMECAVAEPKHSIMVGDVVSNYIHTRRQIVLSELAQRISRFIFPLFFVFHLLKKMSDDLHLPLQALPLLTIFKHLCLDFFAVLHSHITESIKFLVGNQTSCIVETHTGL